MKRISLVVLVALMAFAANVFAQDATKPAEKAKTAEVKQADVKNEEPKAETKKSGAKSGKKHHKKVKMADKK